MLSADNTRTDESPSTGAIPHQGSEAASGTSPERVNVPLLRQLLGEITADQAVALAEELASEELAALVEALTVHA
ncbi:hypothetical protein AB0B04_18545 [Streptomyces xinghaiensis]|uniref:Uncharacterized protein n=2 Tax=Streptomyces TaxID=1883 RepID=A0A420UY54_9ACTN|nr:MULTISPECIES: hypothetical protein [Streptomyces]KNE81429.1 hypothetical protein ADZ36_16835 [Streptomyces fradiae]OFA48221.1 hypothetical protein BEN35_18930 [Streptomyces fradiae]PQM20711.1 hypothetical protein Sfr7A_26395 [Streptomyces xinghaiensis]RKM92652.1 hypothetical protein SFRA_025050 [Streptomyces xinghaiensis]RNC70621.1 hypothetical protein DC095_026040 [Streptomyces xinghaiensis]